jgi:hypothetical protein
MAVAINRDTSLAINRINRDASLIYLEEAEVSQWGGRNGGSVPGYSLINPDLSIGRR